MAKLDEVIDRSEQALKDINARIGELHEQLEGLRKQRDGEFAVLQALRFAKQLDAPVEVKPEEE
jgi:septal ring factor EnvC (AmiA/AmiB activator)